MTNASLESENGYQILFEQTGDAITLVEPETGLILEANKRASTIFGFSKKELCQRRIGDLDVEFEGLTLQNATIADLAGKKNNETQIKFKNGTVIDVEISVQNIQYQGRTVCQVLWRDLATNRITGRKLRENEEKLNQKMAELNAVINAFPGPVSIVDIDFNVLVANEEAYKRFGQSSPDEIIGKKCYATRKGLSNPCPQCNMVAAFKTGEKASGISTPEEEKLMGIATKAYAIPLRNEAGTVWGGVEIIMDVSDIRAIEKDLRESKERMQLALEGADLGLWDWNVTTDQVTFNERWAEMLGYTLDEIDSDVSSWKKLIHPDDLQSVMETLNRHLDGETLIYETEHRMHAKNGTWKWILDRGKVFERDRNGMPVRAAGTHLDITERKRAEEALRNSKNMINNVLTASSVGLAHAVDRKIVWANEEMCALFKFTQEDQYINLDTSMLYASEEEYRRIGKITYEQQQASKVIEFDTRFKRHDGSLFYGYVKVKPLDILDPLKGIIVSIVDITERKRIEEALEAEKERLAVTLRSIGDGVITTDVNSNIQTINKVAEQLTGLTQEEAFNQPLPEVFNIVDELTREKCENPVEKVLKSNGIVELANHTLLISCDGSEYILADSGAPITDKNGNILGVVLVFRDITEKQKLLENTQRSDKLDSIGILAGGIAHDFNNLLSGIFGYIELAKTTCGAGSETADYLDNALKIYTRAKNLTQQLLTFSKGGLPIRKTDSLAPVLKESTQFALSGSNVVPLFDIADDLELCDFDGNQLGQVIDNIVINAVQAMPLGGTVTVSAKNIKIKPRESKLLKPGKYVHVIISDTGIGIPRSILSKIFDPFFTTKQKGNGFGLASAYSIIKKHDGEITVESEQDKGATFHIYLPVSEKKVYVNITEKKHFHQGSGKILIMDDEDYIREITGKILTKMGYTVEYAKNGNEALKLLENSTQTGRSFSAVIMDLTIPGGMGGKEAIILLREFNKDLPVFVTSGYSEDPVMAKPTKYGFTDRIVKPFKSTELTELFYRHLGTA